METSEGDCMKGTDTQNSSRLIGSQDARLLRDLIAIGLMDPRRRTAVERLSCEIGEHLHGAVRAELVRLDLPAARACTRRVA